MARLESLGKVIETDVLVIGGGVAGLWTANRAREFGKNVLVIDKGQRDWGGVASMAGGDFCAVLPGENVDDYVKDLVYYYDGLCEQDYIEELFKQSFDRLKDYQRFGYEFLTGPDGNLKGIPQRGLEHLKTYAAKVKGTGGEDMVRGLMRETDRLGVKRLGRTLVTDLIKRDGKVVGAVGFNTRNGEFYIFRAGAVVLATGFCHWKLGTHHSTETGEGVHTAFRAGAELRNFEFAQVWNVPRLFPIEGQGTLLPLGARFVNAKGEPFMDKYSPILGANTDPHYNVIGMALEVREGRGPIYFDVSKMSPGDQEIKQPKTGWQKLNYDKLVKLGLDYLREKTEWMALPRGSFGGVVSDIKGRTIVPGLFVAGRVRNIDPGVYLNGFSLFTTAATGYIVGESVAEYLASREPSEIEEDEVVAFKKHLYAPLGKTGIPPKEVLTEIQGVVFPYDVSILKSETSLKRALHKIEGIKDELLPQMVAEDAHYLMKLFEARAIAFSIELYLRASLMRKETRAGHYREDYPNRDDKNWLKWIVISLRNDKLGLRTEPVPLDRYRFKPTRYYMDNFKFPVK